MVLKIWDLLLVMTAKLVFMLSCDLEAERVKIADLSGNIIDDGDMVIVSADRDQLKKLQRAAGGFQPGMENVSAANFYAVDSRVVFTLLPCLAHHSIHIL